MKGASAHQTKDTMEVHDYQKAFSLQNKPGLGQTKKGSACVSLDTCTEDVFRAWRRLSKTPPTRTFHHISSTFSFPRPSSSLVLACKTSCACSSSCKRISIPRFRKAHLSQAWKVLIDEVVFFLPPIHLSQLWKVLIDKRIFPPIHLSQLWKVLIDKRIFPPIHLSQAWKVLIDKGL